MNPIDAETLVNSILKYVQAGGTLLPDPNIDAKVRAELGLPIADPELREQLDLTNYDPALDPRNMYPNQGGGRENRGQSVTNVRPNQNRPQGNSEQE